MLNKNSFLNNLPVALHSKQRIELEALAFAFSSLGYSYQQLQREAGALGALPNEGLLDFDHVPLFVNAWAAVDGVHLVRQLIRSLKPKRVALQEFVTATEVTTHLRNKLDHIHQNLPNLAARKGSPPPLFGAATFIMTDQEHHIRVREDGTRELLGWRGYALHAGRPVTTLFQVSSDPASVPHVETPVGLFELHAFGLTVNISEMYFAAQRAAAVFEDDLGPLLLDRVRKAAEAHGADPEEVLKNTGVGIILQLEAALVDGDDDRTCDTNERTPSEAASASNHR